MLLFDAQPPTDPERDESVLTCGDTRTLKFTLIVQRKRDVLKRSVALWVKDAMGR